MEAAWFPSPFSRCGTQGWCDLKSLWEGCDPDGPQVLRRAVLYSNLSSCTLRCRSPNERTSLWASLVKGVVRFQSQQVLCLRTVNCVLQRCAILPLSSGFSHTHTLLAHTRLHSVPNNDSLQCSRGYKKIHCEAVASILPVVGGDASFSPTFRPASVALFRRLCQFGKQR